MPGYNPSPEQESIYNLIPRYQAPTPKQALYRSKHKGKVDPKQYEMGVKKVQPAATFGHPYGMNSTSPDQFLKSHAQEPLLPEPHRPSTEKMRLKAPVPLKTEVPSMGLHSSKNFVTTNAIQAILSKPKQMPEDFRWTLKPEFGEVPQYLIKNKKQIAEEKASVEEHIRLRQQQDHDAHVTQMSEGERQQLLHDLKTKWATVNTAYQKLPFSLDTPAKMKRKETFEKQLTEIEKDVQLLEHGSTVLVLQD
ncbi:hypothetical protein WJX82_001012 [Trebouxia sp. C0006]